MTTFFLDKARATINILFFLPLSTFFTDMIEAHL